MHQPQRYVDIPHVDLLTWIFGNDGYDQDKPILINAHDNSKSYSYRQAKTLVKRMIAGFKALGLEPGDSVCLHSFNKIEYTLVYLAVVGAGGRFIGSNPAYTTSELSHLFNISAPVKFFIVEPELLQQSLPAFWLSSVPSFNLLVFNTDGSDYLLGAHIFQSWDVLFQHGEAEWVAFDDENKAKTTTAALCSTSGTTGVPKAAEISHYAQVAQSVLLHDSKDKPYQVTRLLCLAQFHGFAAPLAHFAPLREGHTTYIMKRYNLGQYVDFIQRYNITETTMANPIIYNLLALPNSEKERLASLRFTWAAGAPLDAATQNKLANILHPDAIVCQVWGLTEAGWITTLHYPERDDTGSVGRLLPNMEAKQVLLSGSYHYTNSMCRIVDENQNELCGEDVCGEILVRGSSMMRSYLDNPKATKNTIVDGWLLTGDIGYQKSGKWYITDRAKDLIKVRGWQVSPAELEACLTTHSFINDAAVIGVDFLDGRGELPRAYVVLDPKYSNSITDVEIEDYLAGRLARYKALAGGVKRVGSIARSSAGKILKKKLREEAKKEIEQARQNAKGSREMTRCDGEDTRFPSKVAANGEKNELPLPTVQED